MPNLYRKTPKRSSRNRLRRSIANTLRTKYHPQKQENLRLSRAQRKQNRPASLRFRGPAIFPPKPVVVVGCLNAGSTDRIVANANFHTKPQLGGDIVTHTLFEKSMRK